MKGLKKEKQNKTGGSSSFRIRGIVEFWSSSVCIYWDITAFIVLGSRVFGFRFFAEPKNENMLKCELPHIG